MDDTARIGVVLTTFDRPRLATRAVAALGRQRRPPDQVVVVDDGSTVDTTALANDVERRGWRFVRQPNQGLSAARNTGARAIDVDWLAFLDDDDVVEDGWLATLASVIEPGVGLVSCAARYVDPDGRPLHPAHARPLGPAYDGHSANMLAGCFLVERNVFDAAGGYAPGLRCSHQTELALRVLPLLSARGLRSGTTDEILIRLERRSATDRPMSSPEALLQGASYVLERHRHLLERDPAHLAGFHAVAGASAARLERWSEARRHLRAAARATPLDHRAWGRVLLSLLRPLGRRVWRTADYLDRQLGA